MLKQFPWRRAAAVLLLLGLTSPALAARLYVDSRPTNLDTSNRYCDMLLREIPRQMLIIMAIDELGAEVLDASLEQEAKPSDHVRLGLERKQNRDGHVLHVDLFDAENKVIDKSDIGYLFLAHGMPRLQDMVKNLDQQNHARWLAMLSRQLSLSPRKIKWDPSLPAPEKIESYLRSIDMQDAFLAIRILHKEISATGESPARLSALVRAYAHLGEASTDLISTHSDVMYARAYLYAQRLITLAPSDPLSHWTRGYLESIHGLVLDAGDDFKHARELAKDAPAPIWASLAQDMIRFDNAAIFTKMHDDDASLAAYFHWRTVEHSCLPGLTIRAARLAQKENPDSMRLFDSIAWNSSATMHAKYTTEAPAVLNRAVVRMGQAPQSIVDPRVRSAISTAAGSEFTGPAMRTMLTAIAEIPREEDEAHLPWRAYSTMMREWNFVQVFSRLWYIDWDTCSDPDGETRRLLPYVSGHRYELVISSFDRHRNTVPEPLLAQIRALRFYDDTRAMSAINLGHYLGQIKIPEDWPHRVGWSNHANMFMSRTALDMAGTLWNYREQDSPSFDETRKLDSEFLDELAPNHPTALYWIAFTQPEKLEPRIAALERQFAGNPVVAFAMGSVYRRLNQLDRAETYLRRASLDAPDLPVYRELAELNLDRGNDVDGYLSTWDRYFRAAEDTSEDAPLVRYRIAMRMIQIGQYSRSLPYAQAAMPGRRTLGLNATLLAMTRMRQFDEVEKNIFTTGQMTSGFYYRWCQETGHGDLDTARTRFAGSLPGLIRSNEATQLIDAAVFYWIEGNRQRAVELLTQANLSDADGFAAGLLALVHLEENRLDEARKVLQERGKRVSSDSKTNAYRLLAEQIDRYLADPKAAIALPATERELGNPFRAATFGNIFFGAGKACELRGDVEQAKVWYRKSLNCLSSNYTARALAAMSLRKLGDEYYQ